MVKLKFINRSGSLVLRISENKERFYKSAKHLLKGNPNFERHWIDDKERFSSHAVSYAENNKALEDFKETYASVIKEYPELSAKQVAMYYSSSGKEVAIFQKQDPKQPTETTHLFNYELHIIQ